MERIKHLALVLFFCTGLMPAGSAQTQYLPQLAVGGPSTGANIQTLLYLFNSSLESISGSAGIFDDRGAPLPVVINGQGAPAAGFTWSLAPGQTQRYLLSGRSSTLETGWMKVMPPASRTVGITLIYQLFNRNDLVSEAGILPGPALTNATLVFDRLGGADVGVALANPGEQGGTITMNLINEMGQVQGTATVPLPSNGHISQFLGDYFPRMTLPTHGTILMTSANPFAVTGLRITGLRLTAIPVVSNARPRPQINSLSPDTGRQGQVIADFVISGTNLANARTINFDPPGGISATIQSSTDTEVRGQLVIDGSAGTRTYNVTVTTRNTGIDLTSEPAAFRVVSADTPLINTFNPTSAERGVTALPFTIGGANLAGTTEIQFDPPTGVTIGSIQSSDTQVVAQLSIDAGAATGARQVRVITPAGPSNTRPFTITADTSAPAITSVAPPTAREGEIIEPFILRGTNLDSVAGIEFEPDGGILSTIISQTATEVRARVTFLSALSGPRQVFVRNRAGRRSSPAPYIFFLQANPTRPNITALTPPTARQGDTIDPFLISGTNLSDVRSVNVDPSSGITVTITSQTATQVQARLVIAPAATVGNYQVTVTSQSGTAVPVISRPVTFSVTAGSLIDEGPAPGRMN